MAEDSLLFEQNPNPMFIYDLETLKILAANEAAVNRYGYSDEEFKRLTLEDIRPSEDRDILLENIHEKSIDINPSQIFRHQAKNGDLFYVQISSQPYPYNGFDSRLVVVHDVTDREKAWEKVERMYKELDHHITNTPLGIVKWDSELRIIEWSSKTEEISGYAKEEVIGKTAFDLNFIDDSAVRRVQKRMAGFIKGEKLKDRDEYKIKTKSGQIKYIRIYGSVLLDKDGKFHSLLSLVEDITEQKELEKTLTINEQKYRRLFENANDGIFIMDGEKFTDCNQMVSELFGYERSEIIGKTPFDFSPEFQPDGLQSTEKGEKLLRKALDGEPQKFEWLHERKNGEMIEVEVSLNRLELTDGVFIQAILRDLTEQKEAEKQLRKSEKLFKNLFLKAPAAIVMVDSQNRIQMVNSSFEELFGYREHELLGKDIDKMIVPEEEYKPAPKMKSIELVMRQFYTETKRIRKDGETIDVYVGAIPVYFEGELIAGFGMYIDISGQKRAQKKLEQSLEDKEILLTEIHHRVKNNLAVISALLELQVMDYEQEPLAGVLRDSLLRVQTMALVHETLYQTENFSDIHFADYVKNLVDLNVEISEIADKDISVKYDVDDIPLNINQAVPCALILNEMISNAIKYAFEDRNSGNIRISMKQMEGRIELSVDDNGVGMPKNFDERENSSMGFTIIRQLSQQLEGEFEITSNDIGTSARLNFGLSSAGGSSGYHMM